MFFTRSPPPVAAVLFDPTRGDGALYYYTRVRRRSISYVYADIHRPNVKFDVGSDCFHVIFYIVRVYIIYICICVYIIYTSIGQIIIFSELTS